MRYDQTDPTHWRQLDLMVPEQAGEAVRGPAVPAELAHERFARRERPRRWFLPIFLFLATCVSTFWAGTTNGEVWAELNGHQLLDYWQDGLLYMRAVLAILLAHEMGHFLQALRYGVPASLPYFIPMPFTPLGTMGAVIGMNGLQANRRELFDIGLSGPIAGLVLAIPITCIGILEASVANFAPGAGGFVFHDPLLVKWLIQWLRPDVPAGRELMLNPWLRAGWVGMLITGLNMMPVSQLDGGHVTYALFGRGAHWIARMFLFLAVVAMVYTHTYMWMAMVFVVFLIGPDHPPTADDEAPLGPVRWLLGFASLAIPILCFPPLGLSGF
ncbi:MAG: site-2 protease family protein [Pirellulales bacterium]